MMPKASDRATRKSGRAIRRLPCHECAPLIDDAIRRAAKFDVVVRRRCRQHRQLVSNASEPSSITLARRHMPAAVDDRKRGVLIAAKFADQLQHQ
ncbi:MAG: hypothetical protein ACXWEU_13430 [Methylomonas sp.]